MEQRTAYLTASKYFVYTLLVLLCYIVQETPGLLQPFGVRSMAVIAAVSALAIHEGELAGGVFGLLGGILCDTAAFHIFGLASMLFLVLGCACGLLILYLVQPNPRSALLLSGGFSLIYGLVSFYFLYGIWGYPGAARLLLWRTLPSVALTALLGVALFFAVRAIRDRFEGAMRR